MALRRASACSAPTSPRASGASFPIRFDYLDTLEGGHLSLQCHPSTRLRARDLRPRLHAGRDVLRHGDDARRAVFLGLRGDADLDGVPGRRRSVPSAGVELDAARFVQSHEAEQHRLYLIPAGTAHASGAGTSCSRSARRPYLYTLRFYDWLRRDLDGRLRPVHVDHAFANLDHAPERERRRRADPGAGRLSGGARSVELQLGRHPDLFFAVHRLDFDESARTTREALPRAQPRRRRARWRSRRSAGAVHPLAYAETIVVPAVVGAYRMRRRRARPARS